jgi:hypothetical protein
MPREDVVSRAIRELGEHAAQEQDPTNLRDLVIEINCLLDIIGAQIAKLEGNKSN